VAKRVAGPAAGHRVVVVSTFPPRRCGIGRYAAQHVAALRAADVDVVTIGLPGSDADQTVSLAGGLRLLRLLPLAWRADALIVHWHDHFYYHGGPLRRIPTHLALTCLFLLCPNVQILCHEMYGATAPPGSAAWRRVAWAVEAELRRLAWQLCPKLICHSEPEYGRAVTAGASVPRQRVEFRAHGVDLRRYREASVEQARSELGVRPDTYVFLCIGFISPGKGFHHAIAGYREACFEDPSAVKLYIVGSALDPKDSHTTDYIKNLNEGAQRTPGVIVRECFVSDEEFDTWITAADAVVLPYERAFSSSVLERAHLAGKPVLASAVGGLTAQVGAQDRQFSDPGQLAALMQALCDRRT